MSSLVTSYDAESPVIRCSKAAGALGCEARNGFGVEASFACRGLMGILIGAGVRLLGPTYPTAAMLDYLDCFLLYALYFFKRLP